MRLAIILTGLILLIPMKSFAENVDLWIDQSRGAFIRFDINIHENKITKREVECGSLGAIECGNLKNHLIRFTITGANSPKRRIAWTTKGNGSNTRILEYGNEPVARINQSRLEKIRDANILGTNSTILSRIESIERKNHHGHGAIYVSENRNYNTNLKKPSETFQVRTDLHTHFGGALSGADLVEIGGSDPLKCLPMELAELAFSHPEGEVNGERDLKQALKSAQTSSGPLCREDDYCNQMGVEKTNPERNCFPIHLLNKHERGVLGRSMDLPDDHLADLKEMEVLYSRRRTFTRDQSLKKQMFDRLKSDYIKNRVSLAEISINARDLEDGVGCEISDKSNSSPKSKGVRMRYLISVNRRDISDPSRAVKDIISVLNSYSNCPHVVGLDINGEEENETACFAPFIEFFSNLKKWKILPEEFQIRVHAGENKQGSDPGSVLHHNIEHAILAGATRIGHGLYGVTDRAISTGLANGVIIELNLSSNHALSNADILTPKDFGGISKWLKNKSPIVIGTDGHGLYGTDPGSVEAKNLELPELRHAIEESPQAILNRIQTTENRYINLTDELVHKRIAKNCMIRPTKATAEVCARSVPLHEERKAANAIQDILLAASGPTSADSLSVPPAKGKCLSWDSDPNSEYGFRAFDKSSWTGWPKKSDELSEALSRASEATHCAAAR